MDNEIELPYITEVISKEQEQNILSLIKTQPAKGNERNQILRYGSLIPYAPYNVSKDIPDVFNKLGFEFQFDSVTINEYHPGQSLDFHFDLPLSGENIHVLSLLGKGDMIFKNSKGNIITQGLEPRSLFTMKDELRWEYQHSSIAHELRYSIVFRDSRDKSLSRMVYCLKCQGYHQRYSTCY